MILTAETLSRELTISFNEEQRAKLTALASTIKNKKLQVSSVLRAATRDSIFIYMYSLISLDFVQISNFGFLFLYILEKSTYLFNSKIQSGIKP